MDALLGNENVEEKVQDQNPQKTEEHVSAEGAQEHWSSKYGEEFKGNKILQRYKSEAEALRALDNQHRVLSKKLLDIPQEDSDEQTWNEVFNKLGRPESPDKYKITLTQKDENGTEKPIEFDENGQKVIDRLAQIAYESGMNNKQFNIALGKILEQEQARIKEEYDPIKAEEVLKKEYKDSYDEFKNIATRQWNSLPDEIKTLMVELPNAKRAKLLYYIGKEKGEDIPPKQYEPETGPTLAQVEEEMKQMLNKNHPIYKDSYYNVGRGQEHNKAREHYRNLLQMKNKLMMKGK